MEGAPPAKKMKTERQFDFSKCARRKVALMFAYLGWDYDGLVVQADSDNTIEEYIFHALEKTKLIESREACGWTRCGRTDKGVSAFRQVASLIVRSNLKEGPGVFWPEGTNAANWKETTQEIDFCQALNGVLPKEVRVLAWSVVPEDFSARFNCTQRVYKYFFARGQLNVDAMIAGSRLLIGEHDFRNFCRIDKNKARLETSYVRTIVNVTLEPSKWSCDTASGSSAYDMLELTVVGSSFLWHQIRCIVAVLLAIGSGRESPEVISQLLDINTHPRRPQYGMASETPLCLFDCSYDGVNLEWTWQPRALNATIVHLQKIWVDLQTKANMVRRMLGDLEELPGASGDSNGMTDYLYCGPPAKNYIPLLQRPTCDGLEDKREKRNAKQNGAPQTLLTESL
uniref:Pseudouridine synthase I TruA alpha/beta domain-containing protein n=1 Tax=Plectus sambesii TaxID=2011161 RepID=A0A914WWN8_9BILA